MKNANRLSTITTDSTVYTFTYDNFGNTTGISAGDNQLASYEYHPYNGKLKWLNYGNGLKVKCLYDGVDRISEICYNTGEGGVEHLLVYLYDEKGSPIGLKYRNSTYSEEMFSYFFFEKNLQGDIVAIFNEVGDKVGTYSYDAWGVCTATVKNSVLADEEAVVTTYNPFRYRGYYYDVETGWYYLQSRYYHPNWGRFISLDKYDVIGATPMGLTDKNLFAYCDNNPITRIDEDGEFWNILIGAGVGAAVSAVTSAVGQIIENKGIDDFSWASVGVAAAGGAISGGLAATGVLVNGQMIANGVIGAVSAGVDTYLSADEDTTALDYVSNIAIGAGIGVLAGKIGGNGTGNRHLSASARRALKRAGTAVKNVFKQGVKTTFKEIGKSAKYYYSQVSVQAIQNGLDAVAPIIKAGIPNFAYSVRGGGKYLE